MNATTKDKGRKGNEREAKACVRLFFHEVLLETMTGMKEVSKNDDGDDDVEMNKSHVHNNHKYQTTMNEEGMKTTLMTSKALRMSLSPPRCPPYGTANRSALFGSNPSGLLPYADHHQELDAAHSAYHRQKSVIPQGTVGGGGSNKNHNHSNNERRIDGKNKYIRERIMELIYQGIDESQISSSNMILQKKNRIPHPHLAVGPELGDVVTRYLGSTILPLSWQNYCRDSGGFASIVDNLTESTIPILALTNPSTAIDFINLSLNNVQTIVYGDASKGQIIDLLFPSASSPSKERKEKKQQSDNENTKDSYDVTNLRGMIFFVHGGAWGSGKPWYYRLIAKTFLPLNLAVAIVGYRIYPKTTNVQGQVHDLEAAYWKLASLYPNLVGPTRRQCTRRFRPTTLPDTSPENKKKEVHDDDDADGDDDDDDDYIGLCAMGHSSGAHIAFLWMVDRTKDIIDSLQTTSRRTKNDTGNGNSTYAISRPYVDTIIGISGPYDISQHFDYEAGRGVEELSPMKAVNGYTRYNFHYNSPAIRWQQYLSLLSSEMAHIPSIYFPKTVLIHGIEDDTVPFTATSEMARILKSCNICHCDEYYVPETGHQDAVMQLMLSGKVPDFIIHWLNHRSFQVDKSSTTTSASTWTASSSSSSLQQQPSSLTNKNHITLRSKL